LDHRAIVDTVCKSAVKNLAGEIGILLGQDLECSDIKVRLTTKDAFFQEVIREKSVLSRMTVSGDQQGECFLLNPIAAAVYLGGTLIMLPKDMIEEHQQSGKLEGELEDAFGEVANIIAGVYTQAFVDKYPNTIRFIKNTIETLVPTKVDPASEEPFPPGNYHVTSCLLKTEEQDLGIFEFVIPAAIFGLEQPPAESAAPEVAAAENVAPEAEKPEAPAVDTGWAAVAEQAAPPAAESPQETTTADSASEQSQPPAEPQPARPEPPPAKPQMPAFADAKKLTDTIFKATIAQLSEEIGALLGQDLKFDDIQLVMTSKADFFAQHCLEKSVLTQLKVSGDREGQGFLVLKIPDAVILGGTLIMLPEDQIEEQAQKNQFEGEVADAFGEVANILAGGLTQVFVERYPKPLRFIKTQVETLIPTKLDLSSDQPFPEGNYYLASFTLHMEQHEPHHLQLLFPAQIFDLDPNQTVASPGAVAPQADAASETEQPDLKTLAPPDTVAEPVAAATDQPVVLIISEQPQTAEPFVQILASTEHSCKVLSYQDDIRQIFQQYQVLGVFLVMSQVGEKGFAAAIKLQSTGRPLPPMIFAGPEWTRSAVLRAVKYGARDIIIMPASNDEIQEKVVQHIRKAS